MTSAVLHNVPMVAGLAYSERVRALPAAFSAALVPEPDNRYNLKAVAVLDPSGGKIGYVAPEVARGLYDALVERAARGEKVACPARRASRSARETSGVEVYLDCSAVESPGSSS